LARVEGSSAQGGGGRNPPTANDNARKLRELRYLEMLQELLVRQTEAARLDEAKDLSLVQVLDSAVPPDGKSAPKRSLIVIGAAACAFLLVLLGIFGLRVVRAQAWNASAR